MEKWNPIEKPYRFSGVRQSSQAGCYGWSYLTPVMLATEEEGRAMVDALMARGVLQHNLDKAKLDDSGKLIGWDKIYTRKRKKK